MAPDARADSRRQRNASATATPVAAGARRTGCRGATSNECRRAPRRDPPTAARGSSRRCRHFPPSIPRPALDRARVRRPKRLGLRAPGDAHTNAPPPTTVMSAFVVAFRVIRAWWKRRITDVTGNRVTWDPLRQVIYLPRSDPDWLAHSIVVFDPAAAVVSLTVPLAWRPGPMAISDDGQFLYVGTEEREDQQVKRLRLFDFGEDASIDLGRNTQGLPYAARELSVAPSQPQVVAMARTIHPGGHTTAGLVVFDDTTPRSVIVGAVPDLAVGPVIDHITWGADATRVFAANDSGTTPRWLRSAWI